MTIRYLDPENGNDANDGLSFGTRKKTFGSATAGAKAGDELRVIASPEPTLVGSATWTDNSRLIALPPGTNKEIPVGPTAWTPSANVTATVTTSALKHGASIYLLFANGFTTGKAAYRALAEPLDLSTFQSLSAFFQSTVPLAANTLELHLCSDLTGDVPVAVLPLSAGVGETLGTSRFITVFRDLGAPISEAVRSISIWANTDPGFVAVYLNNLVACKAASAPDHVSHTTLLGKNTEQEWEWYSLGGIDDSGAHTGGASTSTVGRPYRGVSESVPTFALQPMFLGGVPNDRLLSGASSSLTQISGGWDRESMAQQTGESWLTGRYNSTTGLGSSGSNALGFLISNLGFAHVAGPALSEKNWQIDLLGILACDQQIAEPASASTGGGSYPKIWKVRQVWGGTTPLTDPAINQQGQAVSVLAAERVHGFPGATQPAVLLNGDEQVERHHRLVRVDNNRTWGVGTGVGTRASLSGTILENNDTADLYVALGSVLSASGCDMRSAKKVAFSSLSDRCAAAYLSYAGPDGTVHETVRNSYTVITDREVRHAASGFSWKLTQVEEPPFTAALPSEYEVGLVAVRAGQPVTISAWLRRNQPDINVGLRVREDWVTGVQAQNTWMTAASDAWEQVSLSFTPTAEGVVSICLATFGGYNRSAWIDDLAVSQ
jgi:hypothetical protein